MVYLLNLIQHNVEVQGEEGYPLPASIVNRITPLPQTSIGSAAYDPVPLS